MEVRVSPGEERGASPRRAPAWLPNSHILAIVAGMLAIGGFTSYVIRQNRQITLERWRSELTASVGYQLWTLQSSLQQSQDDARMLADFASVRKLLLTDSGRATLQSQVLSRFEEYRTIYEYDALYLLDSKGQIEVHSADSVSGKTVAGNPKLNEVFESVMRNRHFAVELVPDLHKELTLIFMVPVFAEVGETPGRQPIGAVAIVDRFARDLLPLLTAKRVGSRTVETVLLQAEAREMHYVTVPARRIPASETLREAASSASDARASFGNFVDYRGVEVLAAIQKIESINSVLVCKVDEKEAFADFRRVVSIEAVASLSMLLAYVGLILIHYRSAVAREMREGLERQQFVNQVLEATVTERTGQLAQSNQQLQQELIERQRAEEEVRRFNIELDQRVNERTAELELANKDLEAFSYSVSHDLRAPLRRMRGFSDILLDEHAPQITEEAQQLLKVVNKNAVQMGELIDCLLAFSQLGRQPLRKQKVIPAEIVLSAWQDLSAERDGRRASITIGELGACEADPLLLKQVFVNLLSNALKYSRTRETANIDVNSIDSATYCVRDNGVGFDMRYRDKLFGVFKRLHSAEEYEGIGIGLAIVERIIQRHGGRIWADSAVGQGATFYFTLA